MRQNIGSFVTKKALSWIEEILIRLPYTTRADSWTGFTYGRMRATGTMSATLLYRRNEMKNEEILHKYRELYEGFRGNVWQLQQEIHDTPAGKALDEILDDVLAPAQALNFAMDNPSKAIITVEMPEKDRLNQEINESIKQLKAGWAGFPEGWEDRHEYGFTELDSVTGRLKRALNRIAEIEEREKQEAAREKVKAIRDAGFDFQSIRLDGYEFNADGLTEEESIPF